MARIDLFLVRHGEAAAGYAQHRDPGLSTLGAEQAAVAAQRLTALNLSAPKLLASPLARAQETAAPFAETLGLRPQLETRISEIPAPDEALEARAPWLREVMAGTVEGVAAGSAGLAGRPAHLPLRGHRTLGIFQPFRGHQLGRGRGHRQLRHGVLPPR